MSRVRVDLRGLERRARRSEEKESFEVVEEDKSVRVSVGVRISRSDRAAWCLEVTVLPCRAGERIDASMVKSRWTFVKDLQTMGFSISCQEGGFMVGERSLDPAEAEARIVAIRRTIAKRFDKKGGD